jgi:transglutaminase-like putative cysteine protease
MRLTRLVLFLALALPCIPEIAAADVFPPVTEKERSLASVPGEPNAPAAFLFRKSEFLMMGYGVGGQEARSSRLLVQERVKILTEKGKELGEVSVAHSDSARLSGFKGRTVLPDGRVIPLGDDAKFQRKISRRRNQRVTTVAFPAVEVGAILDYQYELRFDFYLIMEPWYLADLVPVLHAEVLFKIPEEIQAQSWLRDPYKVGIKSETKKTKTGTEILIWADNVPSVPDEPFSLPFADEAALILMLPTAVNNGGYETKLLESWQTVCERLDEIYERPRKKDGAAVKKAREITAAVTAPGEREKAEAIYRFVRDGIETIDAPGIFPAEGASVDKTLTQQRGDYVDKAMLLQAMLRAAKLDARLVWAADRWNGLVDIRVANPGIFDSMFVAVDVDGKRHFLDPSDNALGFGHLRYGYEGMPALLFDKKKPETIVLPEPPFTQNGRRAVLDLSLEADGRIAGKGELVLTGHHAWERLRWQEDEAATLKAWTDWLKEQLGDFQIEDVRFEEIVDQETAKVTWSLKQREEEVLGDEASLYPSAPIGPTKQPFVQDASKRRSLVLFRFADRDEVELRLRWPEGWKLDTQPKPATVRNRGGELSVAVEVDEAGRSLVYRRRFDIPLRQLDTTGQYQDIRALFAAVERSDAEALGLVKN